MSVLLLIMLHCICVSVVVVLYSCSLKLYKYETYRLITMYSKKKKKKIALSIYNWMETEESTYMYTNKEVSVIHWILTLIVFSHCNLGLKSNEI